MSRKIIILAVTVLLLLNCALTVFAEEFDPQKTGSVCVTLTEQDTKETIVGAELSLYYVASLRMNPNGNLSYVYTEEFEQCNADLDDPALAGILDSFVSDRKVSSRKLTTDAEGGVRYNELPLGLYFIRQTGTVAGFVPCSPFLVTVPGEADGGFVYDVDASPKTEVEKLISVTVKKVWNTNASAKAADSVTVQLRRNGKVVKTATLSDENNWQVTYTDLPQSDAYSIKEVNVPKGFTATYSKAGYVFTVTNTSTLIQTGQLIWPIPVLAMAGMLLLVVGVLLLQKKGTSNA
jgi:hypothetical protein